LLASALLVAAGVRAESPSPTLTDLGGAGLLTAPSARMDEAGTLAAGVTWTPLYRHGFVTLQALPSLEVTLRQSAEFTGSLAPARMSGGIDVKFRLIPEGPLHPQIAVGMRGLFGRSRLADPYVVASRRWYDLDVTLGFGRERLGLFAGLEYRTPLSGLSLKLEYTGDRFTAERADYVDIPAPWPVSAGLVWQPLPWLETGVALERGRMAMLRAGIVLNAAKLDSPAPLPTPPPVGERPADAPPQGSERRIRDDLKAVGLPVQAVRVDGREAKVWLDGPDNSPPARAVGRAARIIAARAPAEAERLSVILRTHGLDGTAVSVMRSDLERAARLDGSPAEVWRTADLRPAGETDAPPTLVPDRLRFRVTPRLEQSLAETGHPVVWRGTLDAAVTYGQNDGLVTGTGLRFHLGDNLDRVGLDRLGLDRADTAFPLPAVRSDLVRYARAAPVSVDHSYVAWLWSVAPDWHARLSVGEFEEVFGGLGAELLYRPSAARWAVGLDLNHLSRRVPGSLLQHELGFFTSGHASAYYESADALVQGVLRVGRYLAGDRGFTVELNRMFEGGLRLGAYATRTEAMPVGALEHGISLRIPFGALASPSRTVAPEFTTCTLARDAGQRLDQPLRLYDLTTPVSAGRIGASWRHLMD
jgi:hypothetical protein